MAARLELVVLCAVALLAAVTPTNAGRYNSVSATLLGGRSYSSSSDVSIPAHARRSGSDALASLFEHEKDLIMKEAQDSKNSTPKHRAASRRSPPPTRSGFGHLFGSRTGGRGGSPTGVETRVEAKNGNGYAKAEATAHVRTSGGGSVVTTGSARAGVGRSFGRSRSRSRGYTRHSVFRG